MFVSWAGIVGGALRKGRVVAAASALALLSVGATSGAASAAPKASSLDGCVGQLVFVNQADKIITTDITGSAKGVTAVRRGVDGTLGYKPSAFAFAGEAGDQGAGIRVHFAISPNGRMHRITVNSQMKRGSYVTTMRSKQIGRGFAPVAMAAQVDPISEDSGFVYVLAKNGQLRRYSYSEGAGLQRGVVVASGMRDVRSLTFGRYRDSQTADGTSVVNADVLVATTARAGALREIVVPHTAPAKTKVATLARRGWAQYSQVERLVCDGGRGGFVAVEPDGSGAVFSDANINDLSGRDITKVSTIIS